MEPLSASSGKVLPVLESIIEHCKALSTFRGKNKKKCNVYFAPRESVALLPPSPSNRAGSFNKPAAYKD
jgi:hypothetical protein